MDGNELYSRRKEKYDRIQIRQTRRLNLLSGIRIILFLLAAFFSFYFYKLKLYYLICSTIGAFLVLFIFLVIQHNKVKENRERARLLSEVNTTALKRIQGEWKAFEDVGEELKENGHPFAEDLDIFGNGSLFQWINTAVTYTGRHKLKELLCKTNDTIERIYQKQEAVKELGKRKNLFWRQRISIEGILGNVQNLNPIDLIAWAKEPLNETKLWVRIGRRMSSGITIFSILFFFMGKLQSYYPMIMILIQLSVLFYDKQERNENLNKVYKFRKDIYRYKNVLFLIEKKKLSSKYLNSLKNKLTCENKKMASEQVKEFFKIVDLISDRQNFLYIIFNIIFLWDYYCLWRLEQWKKNSGVYLETWIQVIGEFEALSSLAVIAHDNPSWVMPEMKNEPLEIHGKTVGHPLLGRKAVCNDVSIRNPNKILLITGSNMSGKSTFLRTIGLNLVLAYAGAPVFAESFCCSKMDIYSCMRTSDNLEKNISSFYAELIKIKEIVSVSKEGNPIFFLLDEIFKGTNSIDRHMGAKILIHDLSNRNTLGIVSTHDLELGELEKENHKIANYHFKEYYQNEQIHFDYKMCQGISTTRNAQYLMRMAGIDVSDSK